MRTATTLLLALGLTACAVDPALVQERERASSAFRGGNWSDAAHFYGKLAEREAADSKEQAEAVYRQGASLYYDGRFDEARAVLARLDRDRLGDEPADRERGASRRDAILIAAQCTLESVRLQDLQIIENSDEEREAAVKKLCAVANTDFRRLLEIDPDNVQGHYGRAECLLRLGTEPRIAAYFDDAARHLDRCPKNDPRTILLRARIRREHVGTTVSDASTGHRFRDHDQSFQWLQKALDADRAGSYDFHQAYRETYRYLRNFAGSNSKAASVDRKWIQPLTQSLATYCAEGRMPVNPQERAVVDRISAFLDGFFIDPLVEQRVTRLITEAELIAQGFKKTDTFEKALGLLNGVEAKYRNREDYRRTHKAIHTAALDALIRRSRELGDFHDWAAARGCAQRIQDLQSGSVPEYSTEEKSKQLVQIKQLQDDIRYGSGVQTGLLEIQKLLERQEFPAAEQRLAQLQNGLRSNDTENRKLVASLTAETKARTFVVAYVEQKKQADALRDAGKPAEALKVLEGLRTLAAGKPAWEEDLKRDVARLHYAMSNPRMCIAELLNVANRNDRDRVLLGKAHFAAGDLEKAHAEFDGLELSAAIDVEDLRIAGLTSFQRNDFTGARRFLDEYRLRLAGEHTIDEQAHDALLTSASKLYTQWQASSTKRDAQAYALPLLSLMLTLDPQNDDTRLARGRMNFELKEFQAAHADLAKVEPKLAGDDKDKYGRLVACYGELFPMESGRSWRLEAADGRSATISIGDFDRAQNAYDSKITVNTGSTVVTLDSTFSRGENMIVRTDRSKGRFAGAQERYPIPLRVPNGRFTPIEYRVGETTYRSTVTKTGVDVRVGDRSYANCVQVVIEDKFEPAQPSRKLTLAPGVGIVEWTFGGTTYSLKESSAP